MVIFGSVHISPDVWVCYVINLLYMLTVKEIKARLKLKPVPGGPWIWEVAGLQTYHSLPILSIATPSPPSQPYLTDPPPLHLTPSTRAFFTKCYSRLYLNRPFLFSYFPLLCLRFPARPAEYFFFNFTGFLAIFNVVISNKNN